MNTKLLCAVAALAIGCASETAFADEAASPITITGTAAVVSQYRFRGLAQSDNKPAVQASITASHSSGFYVSMWGSSASAGNGPINIGGTEIDVYGGYTKAVGGVTLDGGLYGYIYPGLPAANYFEIYGSVSKSIGPISAKIGGNYAPDQQEFDYNFTSPTRHSFYVYAEGSYTIGSTGLTLHSHLGHTAGGFDYGKQYLDYVAGVSYKWKAFTLDVSAVGTNLSGSDISTGFQSYIQPYAAGCGNTAAAQKACYADGIGGVKYYRRMAKSVAVVSLTASF